MNFKVWKEVLEIVLGCMNLDLALRVEESIPTLDNLQESQSTNKFLEEIEQFFAKNEKEETSKLLAKLISMKYKDKGNVKEYIMEMSNFAAKLAAKLKSLKLELDEDLIMHLRTNGPSMSLYLINKKRKNIKGVLEESSKGKKPKKNEELTCFFCKKSTHMKKQCSMYAAWHVKKSKFLTLVCSKVNLTFVPTDTWWIDSGAIIQISVTMQDCLWSRPPSDNERFIFVGDDNKVAIETIETFRLQLKTGFHLDLFETFVVPSFRWNLISISSLDKFWFFFFYQNSNVVSYGSLIDNLYMLDVVNSHNEILQIGSRGTKLVSDEIIEPLDLSNFKVCVECIKEKQTNIRKLGVERAKDVLELIHKNICGPFPTTSWNGQQYFLGTITYI
ncbi:hypothetical protein CR513_58849, partial [Mucuna pruriens]